MSENLALEKKSQSKFSKKVKKVKDRVQSSEIIVKESIEKPVKKQRGVVYVGHLPHGFYEGELLAYFKQFGKVSGLQVCRSKKTGRSKGYAFVDFANAEVAKIAAETMDNYLMFNRRIVAKYIPKEKPARRRYKGPAWSETNNPSKTNRMKAVRDKNHHLTDAQHYQSSKARIATINKTLRKLHAMGINYNFRAVDDDNNLNEKIVQANAIPIIKEVVSDAQNSLKKSQRRSIKKKNLK